MAENHLVDRYIGLLISGLENLPRDAVQTGYEAIMAAILRRANIFVCGNGGSAATSIHLANDLSCNQFCKVICLNDNLATLTAIANDNGYERVFVEQLLGALTATDLLIAISTSGNSLNVLKAVEYAKKCGAVSIALTGHGGGRLGKLADIHVNVPEGKTEVIEDIHLAITHIWVQKSV